MAQQQYGVGISVRLADQTLVWIYRDNWTQVAEDISTIFGAERLVSLQWQLAKVWPDVQSIEQPAQEQAQPAPEPSGDGPKFEVCPACGKLKDRWVPPGVSNRTGKRYPGFYACPTPGCKGR
jgi:hypothetical protein